jgi:hypothetical protein
VALGSDDELYVDLELSDVDVEKIVVSVKELGNDGVVVVLLEDLSRCVDFGLSAVENGTSFVSVKAL